MEANETILLPGYHKLKKCCSKCSRWSKLADILNIGYCYLISWEEGGHTLADEGKTVNPIFLCRLITPF